MPTREECEKAAKQFRTKFGIEASDEDLVATIHLINNHSLNPHEALDQSSRSGSDHGIDAWHYREGQKALFIYQSKLTESKALALKGLKDLMRGVEWLAEVIVDGKVQQVPQANNCLFNLFRRLSEVRTQLKSIYVILLSPINENMLEDSPEYREFRRELGQSRLNSFIVDHLEGKLVPRLVELDLEKGTEISAPVYTISVLPETRLELGRGAHLDLAYVPLHSLVDLYDRRGDILFDKNVRLSLAKTKEAKNRLINPMISTLDLITKGEVSPNLFASYHIGVTITALRSPGVGAGALDLEAPNIINGCQTITTASMYLQNLQKQQNVEGIERFNEIKVVAKVVIGVSDDEIKEITNANNRQNPIDDWQLYSNEPIHIEIELLLREAGVFYERQKGKFETLKDCETAKQYANTNGTYIKVVDLGQVIALSQGEIELAAKPSTIFLGKVNHEKIFDRTVLINAGNLIFLVNVFKALKRGLKNYLEKPSLANSNAAIIFNKPAVRMRAFHLALLYFYKKENKRVDRADHSVRLTKIASPKLVEEAEIIYQRFVSRVRLWYTETSKDLANDVSSEKLDQFFWDLAIELGLGEAKARSAFVA